MIIKKPFGGDAVFLGLEHGVERPAHHVEPLLVALAHHGAERFLGQVLGQDFPVIRLGQAGTHVGGGVGLVVGVGVAAARFQQAEVLVVVLDQHRLEGDAAGAEVVGQVQFGGGAGLHADRGAVQFLDRLDVHRLLHDQALGVVEVHAYADQAQGGVARQGLGGVARQHVDLARLQGRELGLRRQHVALDLGGVAEHRGGDGAAHVHVQAGPFALAVEHRETGDAGEAALQEAFFLDGFEGDAGLGAGGNAQQGRRDGGGQELAHESVLQGYGRAGNG